MPAPAIETFTLRDALEMLIRNTQGATWYIGGDTREPAYVAGNFFAGSKMRCADMLTSADPVVQRLLDSPAILTNARTIGSSLHNARTQKPHVIGVTLMIAQQVYVSIEFGVWLHQTD